MIFFFFVVASLWLLWQVYFYLIGYRKRDIRGEVVLVTGAGSGIGRLMSIRFAKLGANLILWDLTQEGLDETKKLIEAAGGQASTYIVDVTNKDLVYDTARKVGRVDVLVNNAGIVIGKSILEATDAQIIKTMEVNTISHFWTIRAFMPGMLERKKGQIVSIASVAGLFGVKKLVDYCASKFGAQGIAESLYMELRDTHPYILTTVCDFFFIRTNMFQGAQGAPLVPILEPEWVADRVVEATIRGEEKIVAPFMPWLAQALKILPAPIMGKVSDILGTSNPMQNFEQTRATTLAQTSSTSAASSK